MNVLNTRERISKVIIELMDALPFYADLIMRSPIKELPKEKGVPQSMAVSVDGTLWYAEKFVGTLSDEELKFVLLHETKHKAFLDLVRIGKRDAKVWNIAADMVRDWQVAYEDARIVPAKAPQGRIVASVYGKIEFPAPLGSFDVLDGNALKPVERVYEEVLARLMQSGYKPKGDETGTQIDEHRYELEDGRKWSDLSEEEREATEENLRDEVVQAAMKAKQRGKLPREIEMLIEKTVRGKVDWRQYLWRHIVQALPFDASLSRPNRRFISQGLYIPGIIKDSLEVVITFDVSGSIDDEEKAEFLAECVQILELLPNVRMTLVAHDSRVTDVIDLTAQSDISSLVLHGGGGTNHVPVFEWIRENRPDARVVVACTDGDTRFPDEDAVRAEVIWVSTKEQEEHYPFGRVVMLE
jgi:predicted metal-dependent peptidase